MGAKIIQIQKFTEIPHDVVVRGYCAEPSPEAALAHYQENYGTPICAWVKRTASGRCTVYVQGE